MKKIIVVISASVFAFGLISCGGGKDEKIEEETVKQPANPLEALANMGNEMEKGNDAAQAKIKERRAKGDTLAMPYAELTKYLPEKIDGYKREEPDGATINMPGASYSSAEVVFKNDNGDRIKVQLLDYNAAYQMYSSVTALWAMGMSVDTPEQKAGGIKFEGDIGGWEEYGKKNQKAQITLGIGYRFWLQIEADNQENTEFVKSIAKSMELSKLSSM